MVEPMNTQTIQKNNTLQVQFSPKLLNIVTVYFLLHVVVIKRVINVEAAKESEATFEDSK